MTIFALFFGAILVTRGDDPATFAAAQHELHPALGIVNTALLLTGSLLVIRGLRRLGDGTALASRFFALTLMCALGFAVVKGAEYTLLINEGHTGGSNDFFMYYFVVTGVHLAHLVIGTVVLFLIARCRADRRSRLASGSSPSAAQSTGTWSTRSGSFCSLCSI
jgi:nitric oxide reductase NorE protein